MVKVVNRKKFIVLNTCIRKERSKINKVSTLGNQKKIKSGARRRREIIKELAQKSMKLNTGSQQRILMKPKAGSLKKTGSSAKLASQGKKKREDTNY